MDEINFRISELHQLYLLLIQRFDPQNLIQRSGLELGISPRATTAGMATIPGDPLLPSFLRLLHVATILVATTGLPIRSTSQVVDPSRTARGQQIEGPKQRGDDA